MSRSAILRTRSELSAHIAQRNTIATAVAILFTGAVGATSATTLSVGPGKPFSTPCKAIGAAAAGDVIEIDGAVSYIGDVCGIYANNLTIRGVNGRPKIDAGGKNAMGKATWVVIGNGTTIENVEMFGAKVPDRNGAALRLEGTGFTLRGSFLHDNENGILSGVNTASDILIENTEFGHNGYGDGYSHNVYIGQARSLVFRNNYSHDANVGHNLKSRAHTNTIVYNRFSSTVPGQTGTTASGQPSYEIDLPNAGTAYVIGNVIEQPSANQNPNMLAFGEEGATNPAQDLYVVNNTFLNDDSSRGTFIMVGASVTTPILMQNNIFSGVGEATTQVSAIDKTNYRSLSPAFVNRAAYDLRPASGSPVVNAGSLAGVSKTGVSLAAVSQYKHVASAEPRTINGQADIGAYEASGTVPTPTPTPTPAPAPTPAPIDTTAPKVSFASPANGAVVYGTVRILVRASDNRAVSKISLMLDGKQVASTAGTSLAYDWNTRGLTAIHTLSAVAVDTSNIGARSTIQVKIWR